MNPLQVLKERLQETLDDLSDSDCHRQALSDAIYSCQFGTPTALEQWIAIWTLTDSHCMTEDEITYQEGVAFVEEQWHKLTGMF